MAAHEKVPKRLQLALEELRMVRIEQSLPFASPHDVYVLAIGEKWVLTVNVVDGGYFDDFHVMRLRDIKRVQREKGFSAVFARELNIWPPELPNRAIDLDSTSGLLRSAGAEGTIIGIEKERQRRAMWIGTLDEVHEGMLWLRELDTKARWSKKPLGYKLAKITSVSWGGRYMLALEQSASERPALAPRLADSQIAT